MQSQFIASRTRTVDLDHEQLLVIDDRPGTRVQVISGGLWLTQERCPDDRFAAAGEALFLQTKGRAVLEAIGRARLQIVEPALRAGRWQARVDALRAWPGLGGRTVAAALAIVLSIGLPEVLSRSFQEAAGAAQGAVHSEAGTGTLQG